EPTFTITVGDVPGYVPTKVNQGGDTLADSDNHDGTIAFPRLGLTDTSRENDSHPIASYDFGFGKPAAIGNYVWFDEDADGQQDAGEPGLPNVKVILYDENGNQVGETWTDSHGGYLFPNLKPGTYYVDVDESTLPYDGMIQTPYHNLNGDFGNQDHSGP